MIGLARSLAIDYGPRDLLLRPGASLSILGPPLVPSEEEIGWLIEIPEAAMEDVAASERRRV